jgi:hypothetical protein
MGHSDHGTMSTGFWWKPRWGQGGTKQRFVRNGRLDAKDVGLLRVDGRRACGDEEPCDLLFREER